MIAKHRFAGAASASVSHGTDSRTTVWVFDASTGQLSKSWGAGLFIMPHGLTIDRDGNVWLTDVGLQQVFKFSPDGY